MRIKDFTDTIRHLTDSFNIPEARRMIQENPALSRQQFAEGQLVQPGPRIKLKDAGIVDSMKIRYNLGNDIVEKLNMLMEVEYPKSNSPEVIQKRIDDFAIKFKKITGRLPVPNEIRGFGASSTMATSTKKAKYMKEGLNFMEETDAMKKIKRIDQLTKDSPQVKKVMEEYKKLGSKRAVEQSTGISRKSQRGYFKQFKPEEIKPANIAGPTTGAKELKKRRLEIIKDLKKYWKSQKGGELILKQMDKKLADIAAENKSILKMSDDAIWKNKKYQDAMRLNVKALKTGEGLKFDRYPGISKKDFAKSVRDLAAKGQFVQPEHIIPIKARNPDSLLAKNIFSAYGEVGGQMEVLKDFSKANTIGKRPTEVFNFLKGQNIPIEKPGFWKVTKKGASKVGKALFGPVEIGTLPLWLAGEALYSQYANKRDLKKALDKMDIPQYKKNLLLEGYRQEAVDLGDVGLEDWAIDQPNISPALEKIGYGDKNELRRDAAGAIADIRQMETEEEAARYEKFYPRAQREQFKRYQPMFAEGGIAGLLKK